MRYVNYVNDEITEMHTQKTRKIQKHTKKKFESQCEEFFKHFSSRLFALRLKAGEKNVLGCFESASHLSALNVSDKFGLK